MVSPPCVEVLNVEDAMEGLWASSLVSVKGDFSFDMNEDECSE